MSLVWNEIGVRVGTDQESGVAVRSFGHCLGPAQHMQRSRPINRSERDLVNRPRANSRTVGTLTPQDLGLPVPAGRENDSIGLSIGPDPLGVLLPPLAPLIPGSIVQTRDVGSRHQEEAASVA